MNQTRLVCGVEAKATTNVVGGDPTSERTKNITSNKLDIALASLAGGSSSLLKVVVVERFQRFSIAQKKSFANPIITRSVCLNRPDV